MISEIAFVRDYTSFWRTISPLSEDFVRFINVIVLDRYQEELESSIASSRRALINEVGFEIFCISQDTGESPYNVTETEIQNIADKTSSYISKLRAKAPSFGVPLSQGEIGEAKEISSRLIDFFSQFQVVHTKPKFPGCGHLDSCVGDVVADDTIYEIKSGGRLFRSIDLRQLVVYLTLNKLSKSYNINCLGLFNPRKGFHYKADQDDFSVQFSGLTSEELCHKVEFELTSCDLMRFEESI